MLHKQVAVPPEIAELVAWFVATVEPLTEQDSWSVNFNGNSGTVQADVRIVEHSVTEAGDKRRVETKDSRTFFLKRYQRSIE